jgi:hypothetical protein
MMRALGFIKPGFNHIRAFMAGGSAACTVSLGRRTQTKSVIARLDRAIQYSVAPVIQSKGCGVLDTPLEPVIGLAEGESRWRSMTVSGEAARSARLRSFSSHP